jgi:hypothetical protein
MPRCNSVTEHAAPGAHLSFNSAMSAAVKVFFLLGVSSLIPQAAINSSEGPLEGVMLQSLADPAASQQSMRRTRSDGDLSSCWRILNHFTGPFGHFRLPWMLLEKGSNTDPNKEY